MAIAMPFATRATSATLQGTDAHAAELRVKDPWQFTLCGPAAIDIVLAQSGPGADGEVSMVPSDINWIIVS